MCLVLVALREQLFQEVSQQIRGIYGFDQKFSYRKYVEYMLDPCKYFKYLSIIFMVEKWAIGIIGICLERKENNTPQYCMQILGEMR